MGRICWIWVCQPRSLQLPRLPGLSRLLRGQSSCATILLWLQFRMRLYGPRLHGPCPELVPLPEHLLGPGVQRFELFLSSPVDDIYFAVVRNSVHAVNNGLCGHADVGSKFQRVINKVGFRPIGVRLLALVVGLHTVFISPHRDSGCGLLPRSTC